MNRRPLVAAFDLRPNRTPTVLPRAMSRARPLAISRAACSLRCRSLVSSAIPAILHKYQHAISIGHHFANRFQRRSISGLPISATIASPEQHFTECRVCRRRHRSARQLIDDFSLFADDGRVRSSDARHDIWRRAYLIILWALRVESAEAIICMLIALIIAMTAVSMLSAAIMSCRAEAERLEGVIALQHFKMHHSADFIKIAVLVSSAAKRGMMQP